MAQYDRSSKWLIQHHGDAILRLAGVEDVVSWRALQSELVQPGQLPDGLLEVRFAGEEEPDLFVLEVATYPERRLEEQLLADTALVWLNRRVLPEVVALVLHPKGRLRAGQEARLQSRRGWTRWHARWRLVELWTLPAEALLAERDAGLAPWIPLTRFEGPPEPVLEQCREIIVQEAAPEERSNLLAVTQVLARLRYNDAQLLSILGGPEAMIESPLIQELVAEASARGRQEMLLTVLQARFGAIPPDLTTSLRSIQDEQRLTELGDLAVRTPDLETFRTRLSS